ncbi:hypothetical protein LQU94_00300 [Peptoniphilus sp. KCTC 25270]|uniref:hypothetical protein n=1 Tax=Peptoniphilus sp. KCTC 25270 TaxID=2897414 RepID=UPI001E4FC95A|nr:hypothetical protein [Peptoniphilus sp. KCTC 25270]MCD1146555.1 hypothetical protein [Peptoniphilus sp. KCTC 25270]
MERQIKKIILKGTSGYCDFKDQFQEKVEITEESITYEGIFPGKEEKKEERWEGETLPQEFEKIANLFVEGWEKEVALFVTDVGTIEIILVHSDGKEEKKEISMVGHFFQKALEEVRKWIPEGEEVPVLLSVVE